MVEEGMCTNIDFSYLAFFTKFYVTSLTFPLLLSLRVHSQDSSAIHSIPRVQIKRYLSNPTDTNNSDRQYALLLKIKNPTLGPIRLRLHSNVNVDDDNVGTEATTKCFENVVIDSMTLQRENVHVLPQTTGTESDDNKNNGTETITLEPAEDSFLGIGKSSTSTPIIDNWGMNQEQEHQHGDSSMPQWTEDEDVWKILHVDNDVAWVQFMTHTRSNDNLSSSTSEFKYVAVPMVMEIELSEDSWESSLIQPSKDIKEGEKDVVRFTIYPVWKK